MQASSISFSIVSILAMAALSACGSKQDTAAQAAAGAGASQPRTETGLKIQRPTIKTQELVAACDWLKRANVEAVLGPLAGEPRLGRNAESPRPDEQGSACVYPVDVGRGMTAEVAVQIDPSGSAEFESAMGMMGNLFARELSEDGHGEAPKDEKRTDGWDYVGGLPVLSVYRIGHLAVQVGEQTMQVPRDKIKALATLVRDQLPDAPFANPGADPNAPGSAPDPCELITVAEAEAVLGKLALPPFRSADTTSLADGDGASCTYYTAGHRVFVVLPTLSDGKMIFDMASGMGGMVRSVAGGSDEGDLLDGPWDRASAGSSGSIYFLKGDKMLEVVYKTSATDIEGATKLAAAAVPRL